MTQPSFVPIGEADEVRRALRLEAPRHWRADRPAELRWPARQGGAGFGTPGPDQGFALRLARRFEERLHLGDGEHVDDALVGCALLASRRSALFGRAPTVHDLTVAFTLWGFLGDPAPELVALRRAAFSSVAHDDAAQRALVDSVPEAALRLRPDEVVERALTAGWAALVTRAGPD